MDLFVVDNIGDDGDLEDREVPIIPKTKAWRKSSTVTSDRVQSKSASDNEVVADAVDADEEEDDDDDDGDYGGKQNIWLDTIAEHYPIYNAVRSHRFAAVMRVRQHFDPRRLAGREENHRPRQCGRRTVLPHDDLGPAAS